MDRKETGMKAAKEAGKILLKFLDKAKIEESKGCGDFVLDADLKSEEFIINLLREKFPGDSILSEERGEIRGESGYRWVIDPLDGTINFKAGIRYFCVSIGLEKDGELVMAFVYEPANGNFYFAEKNGGAYLNGKRIRVSPTRELGNFIVAYSTTTHESPEFIEFGARSFGKLLHNCRAVRLRGSSILDFCNLANGKIDGLLKVGASYWDFAPGCLIAEEAGGRVTDAEGKEWNSRTRNLVASNKIKHEEFLRILK